MTQHLYGHYPVPAQVTPNFVIGEASADFAPRFGADQVSGRFRFQSPQNLELREGYVFDYFFDSWDRFDLVVCLFLTSFLLSLSLLPLDICNHHGAVASSPLLACHDAICFGHFGKNGSGIPLEHDGSLPLLCVP